MLLNRNKAVSDGAISFYLDNYVRSRIAKVTYGLKVKRKYDVSNPEHAKRRSRVYTDIDGSLRLNNGFDPILSKVSAEIADDNGISFLAAFQNTQVSETQEFKSSYSQSHKKLDSFRTLTARIYCYRGSTTDTRWMDVDAGLSLPLPPRQFHDLRVFTYLFSVNSQMPILCCALLKQTYPTCPRHHNKAHLEKSTTKSNSTWRFSSDSRNYRRNFAGSRT